MNMCDFRSAVHIHYDLNSSLSSFSISTFHSTFGFFHLKVNFFSVRVSEFPQECLFLFLLCRKEKIFCRSFTLIEQTSFRVQVTQIFDVKKYFLNVFKCNHCIFHIFYLTKKSLRLKLLIYFRYILLARRKYLFDISNIFILQFCIQSKFLSCF